MRELVHIYKRKLKDCVALDMYYVKDGKRVRESLNLFLYEPTSPLVKKQNKDTMILAEKRKADKILELQHQSANVRHINDVMLYDFIDTYFKGTTKEVLKVYADNIMIKHIDNGYIQDFIDNVMSSDKKDSTKHHYIYDMKSLLHFAVTKDCLHSSPFDKINIKGIVTRGDATEKDFLTEDEIRRLRAYECKDGVCEEVRRAFIFSCYTGLRLVDIKTITWNDIVRYEGILSIRKVQVKTKKYVHIPIHDEVLPQKVDGQPTLFRLCEMNPNYSRVLSVIMSDVGIEKHITFHCGRVTFATRLLRKGVAPITIARLLGHSSLAMVMTYAKIVDVDRQNAINLLYE